MPDNAPSGAWAELAQATCEINGEDQLASIRGEFPFEPTDDDGKGRLTKRWTDLLRDLRIRLGTLLKVDTLSFLLGSGASKGCGGVLIGSIPIELETALLAAGVRARGVSQWLQLFYVTLSRLATEREGIPTDRTQILARRDALPNIAPLAVNYENVLSQLYKWRAALPDDGGTLKIDAQVPLRTTATLLAECVAQLKAALATLCILPTSTAGPDSLTSHRAFLRRLLTRPLNLKRTSVFTLNYDTLIEQAADAEGVVLLDGFIGSDRRVFRPESYDQDLYFPAQTTEGRVHRLDRVIHLYKLHGSITWKTVPPSWGNPYGISVDSRMPASEGVLIYPTPVKYGDSLGMPYAELFRRFAGAIVRPQSALITIGYGFGDEHVNAILRQALSVPSFTLVVVDPQPAPPSVTGSFLARLRAHKDPRLWLISGTTLGTFSAFVSRALPDLREEDVERRVMSVYRSLDPCAQPGQPPEAPHDA